MEITSNIEDNTVTINGETIDIDTLLSNLPRQAARYHYLLNEIYKNRKEVVDTIGDYNKEIVSLTFVIASVRKQIGELDPKQVAERKYYESQIHQISKQITAMKEIRHGTKLNAIWEGKLLSDLEDLEE